MYMIEISESKADELRELASKSMKHLGKLMECIDELCGDGGLGERGGYGRNGMRMDGVRYGMRERDDEDRYRDRTGYRDEDREWDDYNDPYMGERRVRSSRTGRYMRR